MKKLVSGILALFMLLSLTACGNSGGGSGDPASNESGSGGENSSAPSAAAGVPAINEIKLGEDYKDLTASIKILTNRTDIVDTVYADYVKQFNEMYPNITVTYDGVTDYEESLRLRMTTGDWGDICFIPTAVTKEKLGDYFIPLGSFDDLDPVYNFVNDKMYNNTVYGIPNGGTARGVVYNKRIWKDAGYSGNADERAADSTLKPLPATPDDFLTALKDIQDKTDAIPLYTNFSDSWCMGAWDDYIWGAATGDPDFHSKLPHMANPFSDRGDQTGPYAVYYTLYEAVARKLVEVDPMSTDWEGCKGQMNRGEIATIVLGSWAVAQMQEAGDSPDDVGYMPFPITVDGQQYAGVGGNYSYAINNKSSADNQIASLVFMKWLLEESPTFEDEQSIPALKSAEMPSVLADFDGVPLVPNNAPPEGEEDLFDKVNNESECGLNSDDYPDCCILEAALTGSQTLDEIMDEWNAKWSRAQESLGVEVNQ